MGRPGVMLVGRPGKERPGGALTLKARREAGGKARYREARRSTYLEGQEGGQWEGQV